MGTLTGAAVKDRYQKLVWFNTSDNKLYKTSEDGNDTDSELTTVANPLTFSGATTLSSIAEVGSDTDKFLMSDSGVIKYATGANVLSYIGGQATVTAGTNCTFSGTTLNVDDAFINNNADDTMAGTLTIDKNYTGTTTDTYKGMHIDVDQTGIVASGQTVTGAGLDIDINSESVTHVGTIINNGIDLDMTGATDGNHFQTGLSVRVTGADYNTGLYLNTVGTSDSPQIKLVAQADPVSDYGKIRMEDSGDLFISTQGDGTTDSDITLDADGTIILDSANGKIEFKKNGDTLGHYVNPIVASMIFGR